MYPKNSDDATGKYEKVGYFLGQVSELCLVALFSLAAAGLLFGGMMTVAEIGVYAGLVVAVCYALVVVVFAVLVVRYINR